MRPRDIEDEARRYRAQIAEHLSRANDLEALTAIQRTAAETAFRALLQREISAWIDSAAWGNLDDNAKRMQGRALHAKDLLEYFSKAEEWSKWHRSEAAKLSKILATAEEQGRVSRG